MSQLGTLCSWWWLLMSGGPVKRAEDMWPWDSEDRSAQTTRCTKHRHGWGPEVFIKALGPLPRPPKGQAYTPFPRPVQMRCL